MKIATKSKEVDTMVRQAVDDLKKHEWQDEEPLEGMMPVFLEVKELRRELAKVKEELADAKAQLEAAASAGVSKAEQSVERLESEIKMMRDRKEIDDHQLRNAMASGAKLAITSMHKVVPFLLSTTDDLTSSFNTLFEVANGLPSEGRNAMLGQLKPFKESALRVHQLIQSVHNVLHSECDAAHLTRAQAYFLAMGPREMSKTPVDMEACSNNESVWRFKSSAGFQFIPSLDVDLRRICLQRAIDELGNEGFLDGAVWTLGMDEKEIESVKRRSAAGDEASGVVC
ncbi:hypothetical protein V5O48_010797 [Marasmius crinis-equi]|uniref:Uncharacterized protein n=1 Tax=Marasmius crinis-equi TaxID=585013 RepID=A0ABR3F7T0_9AGAR